MLKRTNFVAHHSSFFDFLLLLDVRLKRHETHKNSARWSKIFLTASRGAIAVLEVYKLCCWDSAFSQ